MGGGGSTYDYGFRIYNPSLGKFLSVDPLTKNYPFWSPYMFAGANPIKNLDLDGLEILDFKTPYRLKLGNTQLTYYNLSYSYSDDWWEGACMQKTAVRLNLGLGENIPLNMYIIPYQATTHSNQEQFVAAQTYFNLTDDDKATDQMFNGGNYFDYSTAGQQKGDGAKASGLDGSGAPRNKGEVYIRTKTNDARNGKVDAVSKLGEWLGITIYLNGKASNKIDAKKDMNMMIDAYRDAIKFVDKSWDFTDAAKTWNWNQKDVDQFRIDIINFVADGKLPNNSSEGYQKSVTQYGLKVIEDNKMQGADDKKQLKVDE